MQTLRRATARAFVRAVACLAGFAAVVLFALATSHVTSTGSHQSPDQQRLEKIEQMIAEHDCWTRTAPEGVIPGNAIVSFDGGRPWYVDSSVGFGIWREHQPGTLHAFCP